MQKLYTPSKKNCFQFLFLIFFYACAAQNKLYIPPILSGNIYNLNIQSGSKIFYDTFSTSTYGINGSILGPTLLLNKGEQITINVHNNLAVKSTMHWHGMHVAAVNDGGPHQIIKPNTTWSPSFKVFNQASTLWYHPHGAGQTDLQVAKGLAGMIIIKDSIESALLLPRNYGVDDIPIIIQTKAFDKLKQIAIGTEMDTALFINGTLNAVLQAPAQIIRLRLLNGSSMRTYNFGFSNGQNFYQIATDGGLLDSAIELSRLRLSPGERAEILIDFSSLNGQTIYMNSYSSELANGIYGAGIIGYGSDTIAGYHKNFLNGSDFRLIEIQIIPPTAGAINSITKKLSPIIPFNQAMVSQSRTIHMDTIRLLPAEAPNLAEGPFGINNKTFDIDSINEVIHLNSVEEWTLINHTLTAHPFHIHDVQFQVIQKGAGIKNTEKGWKDVVLVMPADTVKFLTKFENFADNMVPYMYHCHLLHHEDDGMMGSFIVVDTTMNGLVNQPEQNEIRVYPNPCQNIINFELDASIQPSTIKLYNSMGVLLKIEKMILLNKLQFDLNSFPKGIYFIEVGGNLFIRNLKVIKD